MKPTIQLLAASFTLITGSVRRLDRLLDSGQGCAPAQMGAAHSSPVTTPRKIWPLQTMLSDDPTGD